MPTSPPSTSRRLVAGLALMILLGAALWWAGGGMTNPLPDSHAEKPTVPQAPVGTPVVATIDSTEIVAPPPEVGPPRSGPDASNFYKNAFVLFDELTEDEKEMIRKPREEVDAEKAAALFAKIQKILELLHMAAAAEYCEWGMGPLTFDKPMPQISKGINLGRLALWAAAYQFSTDPATALTTLSARAQLGHHLADSLIGLLVQTSFERGAHELLLQNAETLQGALPESALALLRNSPLDANVARAFASEQTAMVDFGRRLTESGGDLLEKMMGMGDDEQRLREIANDPSRAAAEINFLIAIEKSTAAALLLPEAEYQAWLKDATAQISDNHPLANALLPSITAVQPALQRVRVERALLVAGLDIQERGPAQLTNHRDPAMGGVLTYVPTPTGFELRSTYQVKGKPMALAFPAAR